MNDIFISYQWNSKNVVHKIRQRLESKNQYKIWFDENNMKVGDNLFNEMEKGIRNSKIFIGFITKDYCKSDNCKREIRFVNSLTGFDKKKCIYVMLENDIGTDTDGVAILIAGSLRLNAYDHVNDNEFVDKVYTILSKAIDAYLNCDTLPEIVVNSALVDLESIIQCPICKTPYNLVQDDLPDSSKPMLTICNEYICLKCVKKAKTENQTFLCPHDYHEHLVTSLTNASRLHNIIKYFDIRKYFDNLQKEIDMYNNKIVNAKNELSVKINEEKMAIKDHVEQIVFNVNKYLSEMLQKLDNYVYQWSQNQEEKFKPDEITESNKISITKLESNLKQLEIALLNKNHSLIESLKKSIDEDLLKVERDLKGFNDRIKVENDLIKGNSFLTYKSGSKTVQDLANLIGTLDVHDLVLNGSSIKIEKPVGYIRLELKNEDVENKLLYLTTENNKLMNKIKNLEDQLKHVNIENEKNILIIRQLQQETKFEKAQTFSSINNVSSLTDEERKFSFDDESENLEKATNSSMYSVQSGCQYRDDDHTESWISIANRRKLRNYDWKKLYAVLTKNKLHFYNSSTEKDKESYMTIDLEKVYHVKAVTQTDVGRVGKDDLLKIFQLVYDAEAVSGQGTSAFGITKDSTAPTIKSKIHKNDNFVSVLSTASSFNENDDSSMAENENGQLYVKGHKFSVIKCRFKNPCDMCKKAIKDLFNPVMALECQLCHTKIHYDHYKNERDAIQPCLSNEENISTKDLLWLCSTVDEQKLWIDKILKNMPKKHQNATINSYRQNTTDCNQQSQITNN